MALIDIPQIQQSEAEAAARNIREIASSLLGHAESALQQIRMLVRGKRAAVAAELGGDATILLTVYTKLKEAVEAGKEISLEGLPE